MVIFISLYSSKYNSFIENTIVYIKFLNSINVILYFFCILNTITTIFNFSKNVPLVISDKQHINSQKSIF